MHLLFVFREAVEEQMLAWSLVFAPFSVLKGVDVVLCSPVDLLLCYPYPYAINFAISQCLGLGLVMFPFCLCLRAQAVQALL